MFIFLQSLCVRWIASAKARGKLCSATLNNDNIERPKHLISIIATIFQVNMVCQFRGQCCNKCICSVHSHRHCALSCFCTTDWYMQLWQRRCRSCMSPSEIGCRHGGAGFARRFQWFWFISLPSQVLCLAHFNKTWFIVSSVTGKWRMSFIPWALKSSEIWNEKRLIH